MAKLTAASILGFAIAFSGAIQAQPSAHEIRTALELFNTTNRKAEKGDADAQLKLGWMYSYGEGVKEDAVMAVKWVRKSADQGHAGAQFALGEFLRNGEGLKADAAEALKWLHKSADQGHLHAQYALGTMYVKGEGTAKDADAAAKWFHLTAERGFENAQFDLGEMYRTGNGVEKSAVEAYAWYHLAARTYKSAATARDNLEKEMTSQQLAAARTRSAALRAKMAIKKPNGGK